MRCFSHVSMCSLVLLNAFLLLRDNPLLSISELPVFPMENSTLLKQLPFPTFWQPSFHFLHLNAFSPDMNLTIVES